MEAALGTAEWGFSISRQFWGTGLFIEAARAVADFLFREVGIERLEARVAVSNMRAARALTKLGAESEGTLRLAFERRGTRFDQALWAISRDAWLSRVAAPIAAIEPAASGDEPRSSADERPLSRPLAVPRTLVQPGCTLRALVDDDAASLAALLSAPAVARFLPPPPNGVEGFRRFVSWSLRQWDKGRSFVFGIVPPNSERAVGILQLHTLNPGLGIAEWGFALGEPYWGTGLFMRGAELMLQFAFEVIKVRRLEARTAVDNDRGNGVLRKLGATPECRLRRSFLLEENHQDDMLWALLDEEWRRRSGRRVDAASSTPAAVGMSGDVASVSEPA
jgi:RimJ/RimL family protein N-acetyltransferase